MFLPGFVCLYVCLLVRITQKVIDGFCDIFRKCPQWVQGTSDAILGMIWILGLGGLSCLVGGLHIFCLEVQDFFFVCYIGLYDAHTLQNRKQTRTQHLIRSENQNSMKCSYCGWRSNLNWVIMP